MDMICEDGRVIAVSTDLNKEDQKQELTGKEYIFNAPKYGKSIDNGLIVLNQKEFEVWCYFRATRQLVILKQSQHSKEEQLVPLPGPPSSSINAMYLPCSQLIMVPGDHSDAKEFVLVADGLMIGKYFVSSRMFSTLMDCHPIFQSKGINSKFNWSPNLIPNCVDLPVYL